MTLWRLLWSKRNLGTASNILSSTLGQILMSVEDIGGCFSVAPPLILHLNYSKFGKMTLWRLLRSKWNLGMASNIVSSTFGVNGGHWRLPSTEKHFWKITKQIILVIKKEVIVFVKTNYFKCLHFSISQIKFYQIFQTYSGTITNRWEKLSDTWSFFQKNWKSMEKQQFFKKNNHF